jgi:hypothetical protein
MKSGGGLDAMLHQPIENVFQRKRCGPAQKADMFESSQLAASTQALSRKVVEVLS